MMNTIAGSPGPCCIKTVEHTGTARGTTESIAGIETYVARPANLGEKRKIILFFSDVFGPFFLNTQLLMDYWASHGYLVLAIDYLEGDYVQKYLHLLGTGWTIEGDYVSSKLDRARQLTPPWIEAVKEQFGTPQTQWSAAGNCFGAPFVMDCLANDWIAAGAFAHPASLEESHFYNLKKPLLLSCAEEDFTFPLEKRRRAEDILLEVKATYHIQVFSGVKHGFATQGNVNDPVAKWAKERSAETIMSWFDVFCTVAEQERRA
ncbi:alpha/beta-hydrolase [Laetiporus sulphureus 93-53]|uniref:Alpha/beta-hydrolase n=1 Tax=Laetiporus sulphureus 93-53 TaxID=1314785 RepID=A0A165G7N3_9APHY|nr:alpha/beta-hydrolase [Laetiporus sulphureus 93-53]KZT09939.1 alpha/beta-hydrolase [Laetiporus sulphureus 93-53]